MTIIAYDGATLCSDTTSFKYGIVVDDATEKVFVVGTEQYDFYLACAGNLSDILALRAWFEKEVLATWNKDSFHAHKWKLRFKDEFEKVMADSEAIDNIVVIKNNETDEKYAYYLGARGYPIRVHAPYAVGNSDAVLVAMGAIRAGASASTAVDIAIDLTKIGSDTTDVFKL